jgi:thioredoxin reductase (NADPH)
MGKKIRDVIMIGAGPSALSAAIYTTRENIDTVLYEKAVVGGLAAITDRVDNYPGFPDGVPGLDLAERFANQAERFGSQIEYGEVSAVRNNGATKIVIIDGEEVKARTVLIATGSEYNKIGVPGEAEYYGRGVHYCATCDGAFYRDKDIVVVGGGNSGYQEAMFLTRFAKHIDLLVRSTPKASRVLQDEIQQYVDSGTITIHTNTVTDEIVAKDGRIAEVKAIKDGKPVAFSVDGVFIFVGLRPNTQFLAGSGVELDKQGLIKTDQHLETNIPGIFASGDVRSGATMQVASAVGEGATAALSIREYLEQN